MIRCRTGEDEKSLLALSKLSELEANHHRETGEWLFSTGEVFGPIVMDTAEAASLTLRGRVLRNLNGFEARQFVDFLTVPRTFWYREVPEAHEHAE